MTKALFPVTLVGVASAGALVGLSLPSGDARSAQEGTAFGLCHVGGGLNCVVDGDTLWVDGQKIRVADIDAPETHDPKCSYEAELGRKATLRLQVLVNQGSFELQTVSRDEDKYGRKLRTLVRSGHSLGRQLVSEGLARSWDGSRHPWC